MPGASCNLQALGDLALDSVLALMSGDLAELGDQLGSRLLSGVSPAAISHLF